VTDDDDDDDDDDVQGFEDGGVVKLKLQGA